MILAATLLGLAFCSELFLTWYEVDETGIRIHGIWRGHHDIRWEGVEWIDEPRGSLHILYLRIRSKDVNGHKVKFILRNYQTGLPELAVLIREHVPEEMWRREAERFIMKYYHKARPKEPEKGPTLDDMYDDEIEGSRFEEEAAGKS